MSQIITVTDATWDEVVGQKAALILISNGQGVRGEFTTNFKNTSTENPQIVFAQINPDQNPATLTRFNFNEKPLMIGLYQDEVIVRRSRPWGTDVPLTIELLEERLQADAPEIPEEEELLPQEPLEEQIVDTAPINVTDQTFQPDVVEYSHRMPVLIDFWAEWCGPCRTVAPILDKLATEFAGQIRIAKVDVDANPGLSQAFRVQSIPTIMAFKAGQPVFAQPGAFPEPAFRDLIQQLIDLEVPQAPPV